jgi:RNA polymerase-binding transcription factor DksA
MSEDLHQIEESRQAERDELVWGLRQREAIAVEKAPGTTEDLAMALDREAEITQLHRDSRLLRDVRAAPTRLDAGEYRF